MVTPLCKHAYFWGGGLQGDHLNLLETMKIRHLLLTKPLETINYHLNDSVWQLLLSFALHIMSLTPSACECFNTVGSVCWVGHVQLFSSIVSIVALTTTRVTWRERPQLALDNKADITSAAIAPQPTLSHCGLMVCVRNLSANDRSCRLRIAVGREYYEEQHFPINCNPVYRQSRQRSRILIGQQLPVFWLLNYSTKISGSPAASDIIYANCTQTCRTHTHTEIPWVDCKKISQSLWYIFTPTVQFRLLQSLLSSWS